MEIEFLTVIFRAIMGKKMAIWPNISSRWAAFWAAEQRWTAGVLAAALCIEGSSVKPRVGAVLSYLRQLPEGQERCEFGV